MIKTIGDDVIGVNVCHLRLMRNHLEKEDLNIPPRLPSCKAKGFSVEDIMKVAGWCNSGTFATFYHKTIDNTANFGNMVLQQ